jgi:succinoglycan biosynthesis transport protein ExoP
MLRRRKTLPVLAKIAAAGQGSPRVRRADFEAFSALLAGLGESRVVLVTGVQDGKSAAAIGLATTATAAGRRTALLECDLAEPKLAGALGLAPAPGLHEYLRHEASAPQILQPAVLAGPKSRGVTTPLICVVAGKPTPNGAALLTSEDFRHATAKLRNAYDLVVIEGPPLEGDGKSLKATAAQVDATLACVGDSKLPRKLPVRVTGLIAVGG